MGNDPGFGIGKGGNLDGKLAKRERDPRCGAIGIGIGINGNRLPTATDSTSKSEGYKTTEEYRSNSTEISSGI